jgi:hypothetical protein
MANITLTFGNPLPVTVQTGDIAWYLDISAASEVEMGPITSISGTTIIINAAAGVAPPSTGDFVFYVKDPVGHVGSLKGYYAEIQFRNNTINYAELFSVGTEIFESSK